MILEILPDALQRMAQFYAMPGQFLPRTDPGQHQQLRRVERAAAADDLGALGAVAAAEAEKLGLSRSVLQRYLGNFRYHFEPPDRDGLAAFAALALPDFHADELRYWER